MSATNSVIQSKQSLDDFYATSDPWGYEKNSHDLRRKQELLSLLPSRVYQRTLDIGCGNGFLTFELPGHEVIGIDISDKAIHWAREAAKKSSHEERYKFVCSSLFELPDVLSGTFDLIIVTGVLYKQYIGNAISAAISTVDNFLNPGGILISCHINDWNPPRFPYNLLDMSVYPYREYHHHLEVYVK